jgi:hypothetical protein
VILPFKTYGEIRRRARRHEVTDALTNMLSRVQSFRVISRQTARAYRTGSRCREPRQRAACPLRAGRQHCVQEDRLRVNVELIDPATRLPAWTSRIAATAATASDHRRDRHAAARELQFELINIERAALEGSGHRRADLSRLGRDVRHRPRQLPQAEG